MTTTLDKLLKEKFAHKIPCLGAGKDKDTLYEENLREISYFLRSDPQWMTKLDKLEAREKWRRMLPRNANRDMGYALDEMRYYKSLHWDDGVMLSSADQVWQSDSRIDSDTANKLKEIAKGLEAAYKKDQKKVPANKDPSLIVSSLKNLGRTTKPKYVDYSLIDPAMYPLVYGTTRVLSDPMLSPKDALSKIGHGSRPEALKNWNDLGPEDYSA